MLMTIIVNALNICVTIYKSLQKKTLKPNV
jgi:hypothetical protein